MKYKIFYILFILSLFSVSGQNISKKPIDSLSNKLIDSLPNLWIITMDKTGSMTDTNYGSININLKQILNLLKTDKFFEKANFNKDKFVFYNTGIINRSDSINKLNHLKGNFIDNFIHSKQKNDLYFNVKFKTKRTNGITSYLKDKMGSYYVLKVKSNWKKVYPYQYSFVSLLRPLALRKTLDRMQEKYETTIKERFNISNFNNIYILNITDDGDINDQWLKDSKTIEKYGQKYKNEIENTISQLVVSPYNLSAKPFARFIKVKVNDDNYWKIFLYKYQTLKSQPANASAPGIFTVEAKDNTILLKLAKKQIPEGEIELVSIDSISLNNNGLNNKYILNNSIKISSDNIKNKTENYMQIKGTAQVIYNDDVLGKKRKKIYFTQNINFKTAAFYSFYSKLFFAIFILVLICISYYLTRIRFIIITPIGKFTFRNGAFFFNRKKTMSVLLLLKENKTITDYITFKSPFIRYSNEEKFEDNVYNIAIISKNEIILHTNHSTEEYKKGKEKKVSSETQPQKDIINKYVKKNNVLFITAVSVDDIITFSAKSGNKEYIIETISKVISNNSNDYGITKSMNEGLKIKPKKAYYLIVNVFAYKTTFNLLEIYANNNFAETKLVLKYSKNNKQANISQETENIKKTLKKYHKKLTHFVINEKCVSIQNRYVFPYKKILFPQFITALSNEQGKAQTKQNIFNPLNDTNQIYDYNEEFNNKIQIRLPQHNANINFYLYKHPNLKIFETNKFEREDLLLFQYHINSGDKITIDNNENIKK